MKRPGGAQTNQRFRRAFGGPQKPPATSYINEKWIQGTATRASAEPGILRGRREWRVTRTRKDDDGVKSDEPNEYKKHLDDWQELERSGL
jgi:hypothetical protein